MLGPTASAAQTKPNVLGPQPGYSPQIGTLVSEMTWMRGDELRAATGLTPEQFDFLLEDKANRIGALLLHLAAAERLCQLNTLREYPHGRSPEGRQFDQWDVALELGAPAREATLAEFRKRDDQVAHGGGSNVGR